MYARIHLRQNDTLSKIDKTAIVLLSDHINILYIDIGESSYVLYVCMYVSLFIRLNESLFARNNFSNFLKNCTMRNMIKICLSSRLLIIILIVSFLYLSCVARKFLLLLSLN